MLYSSMNGTYWLLAVLVLIENNTAWPYAEYVDNINTEPDYDAAIAAVKS